MRTWRSARSKSSRTVTAEHETVGVEWSVFHEETAPALVESGLAMVA
jgi:hypothetical protein